ncbi:MAG: membrane protein insertase YidC [Gammaproteobacteria bacterium]|nr:membrane protein insertase YidC [Gammaproteobacteria bacterium]
MENQRLFLLIAFTAVSFFGWQTWQADKLAASQPITAAATTADLASNDLPAASVASANTDGIPEHQARSQIEAATPSKHIIRVTTDTLDIQIDLNGGDVIHAALPGFTLNLESKDPVVLLQHGNAFTYLAQSGLTNLDSNSARPLFTANASQFSMAEGSNSLVVPLTYRDQNGLEVTKSFTFTRGKHSIKVDYEVENGSTAAVDMRLWARLRQSVVGGDEGSFFMPTFRGAAYSTADKRYEKLTFEQLGSDDRLKETTLGGWVAMLQHYFVSAWVPVAGDSNELFSNNNGSLGDVGYLGPIATIDAGSTATFNSTLYVGPKDQESLSALSPSLNLVVDYGILWFISQPLHWLLTMIHSLVGNWGVAIILITLAVKGALYKLTKTQYVSMAKMRLLQPKLAALKERYGDDRQKMSAAMMELYKKEKVNPLGGCLPILLQMPIFIALYWVLVESVELRQAPFALWIQDLSVKDPYFVLPLLMGASMFIMQKLSPTAVTDPMQQKMMQWMPVIFTAFFLMFPSGLVLYWLFSNLVSIGQQWMINRAIDKQGLKASV